MIPVTRPRKEAGRTIEVPAKMRMMLVFRANVSEPSDDDVEGHAWVLAHLAAFSGLCQYVAMAMMPNEPNCVSNLTSMISCHVHDCLEHFLYHKLAILAKVGPQDAFIE